MEVSKAIEALQKLDPNSHIIIAWWDDDYFQFQQGLEKHQLEFWPWGVTMVQLHMFPMEV